MLKGSYLVPFEAANTPPVTLPSSLFSLSLVASCCYKMLESPSAMKEKTVKEELFQLLGLLVKKYNQTLSELHTDL